MRAAALGVERGLWHMATTYLKNCGTDGAFVYATGGAWWQLFLYWRRGW